jgi:serine/threonine protein phosphatase PrpC
MLSDDGKFKLKSSGLDLSKNRLFYNCGLHLLALYGKIYKRGLILAKQAAIIMKGGLSVDEQKQQFQTSFLTDAGVIATNKEYFGGVELADFACWVIAERLDSCVEKESARLAGEQVIRDFTARPTMSRAKIKRYLTNAHQKLIAESEKIKLRVGLLLVVTDYSRIIWAVAGNIRLYHLRRGKVNLRSKDQTLAQIMLDAGNLEESEMCLRNERNSLINFLGIPAEFKPLISQAYQLCEGDQLLLCNIKLWENLSNGDIESAWTNAPEAVDCVNRLKTFLLAKKPQVSNFIMSTIAVRQVRQYWTGKMEPYLRAIAIGVPVSVLLLTGAVLLQWQKIPDTVTTAPSNPGTVIAHIVNNTKLQQKRAQMSILTEETAQTDNLSLEGTKGPVQQFSNPVLSVSEGINSETIPQLINTNSVVTQYPNRILPANATTLETKRLKEITASRRFEKEAVAKKPKETASGQYVERTAGKKSLVPGEFNKIAPAAKKSNETVLSDFGNDAPVAKKLNESALSGQLEKETAVRKMSEGTLPSESEEQMIITDQDLQIVSQTGIAIEPKSAKPAENVSKTAQLEKSDTLTERQTKEKQARLFEAIGDDRYQNEQYSEALEYYKLAYGLYQELGMREAAAMVDRKISITIKEKLVFLLKKALK